ncbi:MAG: Gfo/Idh/MocA family oxidoreductase [Nitrososphaeria archaeon]
MGLGLDGLKSKLLGGLALDIVDVNLCLAVVGLGKMGLLHSAILNLLRPNTVKFVVDKSRLVTLGGSFLVKNVGFFRSLEKILREDVDAVYVTAPAETHYSIVSRLFDAGIKAVFIEKPPTVNFSSFMELLEDSRGKLCMVGFQKRYALPFRHVKILLSEGVIGDIKDVKCYIKSSDVLKPTQRFNNIGRGVLLDLGIHLLDLLCWLFGELSIESAQSKSLHTSIDDTFIATLATETFGVKFEASWSDVGYRLPETFIEINGDKGVLKVTEDYVKVALFDKNKSLAFYKPHYYQRFPPVLVADPEYTIEDMHFLSCLTMNKKAETDIESCKSAMGLMEELYARVRDG